MQKTRWIFHEPPFKAAPNAHACVHRRTSVAKRRRALNERARGLKKFIDLGKKIKMKSNIYILKKNKKHPEVPTGCSSSAGPGWGSCCVNSHCWVLHRSPPPTHHPACADRRDTFRHRLISSLRSTCVWLEAVQHWGAISWSDAAVRGAGVTERWWETGSSSNDRKHSQCWEIRLSWISSTVRWCRSFQEKETKSLQALKPGAWMYPAILKPLKIFYMHFIQSHLAFDCISVIIIYLFLDCIKQ